MDLYFFRKHKVGKKPLKSKMALYTLLILRLAYCPVLGFIWANYTFLDFICFLRARKFAPSNKKKVFYIPKIFLSAKIAF